MIPLLQRVHGRVEHRAGHRLHNGHQRQIDDQHHGRGETLQPLRVPATQAAQSTILLAGQAGGDGGFPPWFGGHSSASSSSSSLQGPRRNRGFKDVKSESQNKWKSELNDVVLSKQN